MSRKVILIALIFVLVWAGSSRAGKIYWAQYDGQTGGIVQADSDGDNRVNLITGLRAPHVLAIDHGGGKLYWADPDQVTGADGRIQRADLDGGNLETLFSGLFLPWAMTLDEVAAKIYWWSVDASTSEGSIRRANLDGSSSEVLFTVGAATSLVTGLALDPVEGKIYWTSILGVERANLDGSMMEIVISGASNSYGLALDSTERKIYWSGGLLEPVRRADFDGANVEELFAAPYCLGLALDPNERTVYASTFDINSSTGGILKGSMDSSPANMIVSGVGGLVAGVAAEPGLDTSIDCFAGNVNASAGEPVDVLFLNGEARSVEADENGFLAAYIVDPPGGGDGEFVIHANLGVPSREQEIELPDGVGSFCFPVFLNQGADPVAIWNNIGRSAKLGASRYFDGAPISDPRPAPELFLVLHGGDPQHLPMGTTLTFQGVIRDDSSSSPLRASTTNAVVLTVMP